MFLNSNPFNDFKERFVYTKELKVMLEWLNSSKNIMMLYGSAGSGKTSLAKVFEKKARENFKYKTFYFSVHAFENVYTIVEIFRMISRINKNERNLFILDDFHDLFSDKDIKYFLGFLVDLINKNINSKSIIITRSRTISGLDYDSLLFQDKFFNLFLENFDQSKVFNWIDAFIQENIDFEGNKEKLQKMQGVINKLFEKIYEFKADIKLPPRLIVQILNESLKYKGDLQNMESLILNKIIKPFDNIVLLSENNRFKAYPANQFLNKQVITPSRKVIEFTPYIIIQKTYLFIHHILEEFEEMINSPNIKEDKIQRFFEKYDFFLKGIKYKKIISQPIFYKENQKGWIKPDFFLLPIKGLYGEILDLKLPQKKLIIGPKPAPQYSYYVKDALTKAREYVSFFDNPKNRERVYEKYKLAAFKPTVSIIIGRTPKKYSQLEYIQAMDTLPKFLKIITYDELLSQMKRFSEIGLF